MKQIHLKCTSSAHLTFVHRSNLHHMTAGKSGGMLWLNRSSYLARSSVPPSPRGGGAGRARARDAVAGRSNAWPCWRPPPSPPCQGTEEDQRASEWGWGDLRTGGEEGQHPGCAVRVVLYQSRADRESGRDAEGKYQSDRRHRHRTEIEPDSLK